MEVNASAKSRHRKTGGVTILGSMETQEQYLTNFGGLQLYFKLKLFTGCTFCFVLFY